MQRCSPRSLHGEHLIDLNIISTLISTWRTYLRVLEDAIAKSRVEWHGYMGACPHLRTLVRGLCLLLHLALRELYAKPPDDAPWQGHNSRGPLRSEQGSEKGLSGTSQIMTSLRCLPWQRCMNRARARQLQRTNLQFPSVLTSIPLEAM